MTLKTADSIAAFLRNSTDSAASFGVAIPPEVIKPPEPKPTVGAAVAIPAVDPSAVVLERLAFVSSEHMTPDDISQLWGDGPPAALWICQDDYGCQFGTPRPGFVMDPDNWYGFSPELLANLQALGAAGFDRVEFNDDAPEVPGLYLFPRS